MNLGTASILRANARALPLADDTVDLVVTSPPYFALRSYQDGGVHYGGQIGSEGTPAEFVDALLDVTHECVRVLKPSGSLWVNLGDKYVADNRGSGVDIKRGEAKHAPRGPLGFVTGGMRQKSLMGLPWRYALRCIDDLGLILRAEVIWSKPNGLPESVTDRVRRSHEQWFCFEQSGGVETAAQNLPFCPLCGRPVDARSTLVARLKEADRGVESGDLPGEVRPDGGIDGQDAGCGDHDVAVVPGMSPVPVFEALDAEVGVDAAHLVEHGSVPVVDADSQQRATLPPDQRDGALSVDDSGKPADVCECVGHPLIINDEPWIPQSLAAEIMQSVADGECDPQQAADFLSGDYARNHSVWFHFTLNPRYFSAVDEIREPHAPWTLKAYAYEQANDYKRKQNADRVDAGNAKDYAVANPLGKLPGSVWTIATEPLKVPDHLGIDHFAAFPTEWPKRIIQGWSPAGVCVGCGEGRRPIVAKELEHINFSDHAKTTRGKATHGAVRTAAAKNVSRESASITGYVCACPEPIAPTMPAVVLDPFGGTGTTAMVAKALGRHGISVDMSADYCRLAEWRTNDRNQLAKVLGIEKTDAPDPGQMDLFGGVA